MPCYDSGDVGGSFYSSYLSVPLPVSSYVFCAKHLKSPQGMSVSSVSSSGGELGSNGKIIFRC